MKKVIHGQLFSQELNFDSRLFLKYSCQIVCHAQIQPYENMSCPLFFEPGMENAWTMIFCGTMVGMSAKKSKERNSFKHSRNLLFFASSSLSTCSIRNSIEKTPPQTFKSILLCLLRSSEPDICCFVRLYTMRISNEKVFSTQTFKSFLLCLRRTSKPDIFYFMRLYSMKISNEKTSPPQTFKCILLCWLRNSEPDKC